MKHVIISFLTCLTVFCLILMVLYQESEKERLKRLKYVRENFANEFEDPDSLEQTTINTEFYVQNYQKAD